MVFHVNTDVSLWSWNGKFKRDYTVLSTVETGTNILARFRDPEIMWCETVDDAEFV